jgi:hypothetical protein
MAEDQIKKLQSEGVDTIVSYWTGGPMHMYSETSKQLGEIAVEEYSFIFYMHKGQAYVMRCMTYMDSLAIPGRKGISKPMIVDAVLMLKWAVAHADKISRQPVCSHIIQVKPDSVNTVFDTDYPSHPDGFDINIYVGTERLAQSFTSEDFQYKYYDDAPENLNYSYNIKTDAYKLYLILKSLTNSVKNDLSY